MPALLAGIWGYVASALAAAALAGYLVHTFDDDAYQKLKNADARAAIKSAQVAQTIQKNMDAANLKAAVQEAASQQQIVTQTQIVTKEIPVHVHDTVSCPGLTVGLARQLRATAAGLDPDALELAAGQSDDQCSDATPTEVAGWFAAYADSARKNAEQLNALEANVRDLVKTANQ